MSYPVLLVDDDDLVLSHLRNIIDWKAHGFEIVSTQNESLSALSYLCDHSVSVIISDVNMPVMDGLEFLKIVRKKYPSVRTVLLTINSSFGCIQAAMNGGVDFYLLKPLDAVELISTMGKVKKSLENTDTINELHVQAARSERTARDQFLTYLMSNSAVFSSASIRDKLRSFHCQIPFSHYQLLAVHLNAQQGELPDDAVLEITGTIEDAMFPYAKGVVFPDAHQVFEVLISVDDLRMFYLDQAKQIARSIRSKLLDSLRCPSTIIISRLHDDLSQLSRCYYETLYFNPLTEEARKQKIVVFEERKESRQEMPPVDYEELRKDVLLNLRLGSEEKLRKKVTDTFGAFYRTGNYELFNMVKMEFVLCGIIFMQENKISMESIRSDWAESPSAVTYLNKPSQCRAFVLGFYHSLCTAMARSKVSTTRRIAERCTELVAGHLGDPALSVSMLARELYMSEDYLSRQFKSEMKVPLVRYIGEEKLARAKHLLEEGNGNIQQVAALSGFSDSLYFSKCFKKKYGISPSDYQAKGR